MDKEDLSMKKRLLYFIASCVMIGGLLTGCANDEKPSNKTTEGTTIETEIVTEVDTKIENAINGALEWGSF
jgi:hypothetical protein